MDYSLWGQATSPEFEQFAEELGGALERAGFVPAGDPQEAALVINLIDASDPKPFRRSAARARSSQRSTSCPRSRPTSCQTNYPLLVRALANIVLCYVPGRASGSRRWSAATTASSRGTARRRSRKGVVERLAPARDARGSSSTTSSGPTSSPSCGTATRSREEISEAGRRLGDLDLLPAPVPDRGSPQRARPAPREAALRDRRAVVRQPLAAQGRQALLDERERRRQDEARDPRPRHPARLGLRRRRTDDGAERAARRRAAARVGRRDRALDDLPGAPGRRRASSTCTPGWRASTRRTSTTRAGRRSSRARSPTCSRASPTRRTPSSVCATTASPSPATSLPEILDRIEPKVLARSR